MKVCLIQPPINDFYETEIRNIPLGLISIGSNLKNHNVQILDLRKGKRRGINFPGIFTELKKYYKQDDRSPFGLYKNYYRFGYTFEEFHDIIPKDIDIFGISALFTTYSENVIEIIQFIKEFRNESKIVIGGHACAAIPGSFIEEGADYEFFGEGELALQQLLESLEKNEQDLSTIPNLIWKKKSKTIINKQEFIQVLNNLSYSDYSISGIPNYTMNRKKHAMIMVSRGCPNKCSFCSIHQVMGNKYRTRNINNVLEEIDQKIHQGFRSFDFEDDHFGGNKIWLHKLLDSIIEKYSTYNLSLQAMNGITATNLDEELLQKMKKAGFSSLNLALVSEDEIEQTFLHRPFNTKQFIELVHIAKKHDFFITAYLILGLPNHTINQMLDSILFLADLPVLIGPSFFYLVPNTPIFNQCKLSNLVHSDTRTFRSSYMPYENDNFKRIDLMTLFRITRIINFMKEIKNQQIIPNYKILKNQIHLSECVKGNEKRLQLGLALIKLLKSSKKIFGVTKKKKNIYILREESVNEKIVEMFLNKSQ